MTFRSFRPILVLCAVAHAVGSSGQAATILIDGRFDDWSPALNTYAEPAESIAGIDLLSMQVTNDQDFLYVKVVLDTPIDLEDQLVPHRLTLYIDADDNAATGFPAQTGFGSELGIRFNQFLAYYDVVPSSQVSLDDLQLLAEPVVTSTTFELAIPRNVVPDGVNPLFQGPSIKLLFKELDSGDVMPNPGSTFTHVFDNTPLPALVPIPLAREQADDIRVAAYNVLSDGFNSSSRVDDLEEVVTALAPDIIGFSECFNTATGTVKGYLDTWLPTGLPGGWQVVKDEDLIVASRWPILNSWTHLYREFPVLVDLPAAYGTDLLFTAAHLLCCSNDAGRQDQVDSYVAFMHDAITAGGLIDLPANTPFVYAGDLNLVGDAAQLNTLLIGAISDVGTYGPGGAYDWDGSAVTDNICRHTHANAAYTWRNDNGSYTPGRLDYILHSDAVLALRKSFTLRTEVMPPAELVQWGLGANATTNASDHFPVVADFAVPQVNLAITALLDGPLAGTLMQDHLRQNGLLPLQEPYTAIGHFLSEGTGSTLDPALLSVTGPGAPVDWVVVELRDAVVPTTVVAARPALLLRDGSVVPPFGTGSLGFAQAAGSYHVALRHRNHLGVMTAVPLLLSATSTVLDLSDPGTATHGVEAQKDVGGRMALWAGDVSGDGSLRYTGSGNDRDLILGRIGGVVVTGTAAGYFPEDVDLDGVVRYTGAGNDRDRLLQNVGGVVPTSTRTGQLP